MSAYLWVIISIFLLTIVGGSVYAVMGCTQSTDVAKQNDGEAAGEESQTKSGDAETQQNAA